MKVSLENVEINAVSDRAAMALPESFVASRFDELGPELAELRGLGVDALVRTVESVDAPPRRRFAAGTLLALLGDPRIGAAPALVDVPGGRATIGLPLARVDEVVSRFRHYGVKREWIEKECPAHEVTIAPFRLGRYPVTNLEYRRFLEATGFAELPSSWALGAFPAARSNHPVYTVSAGAADAYVAWLARETGRRFRLPREVEWEYAAAGPAGREFPWGEHFDAECANTLEAGALTTTPVGMYPRGASYFGLADMGGNVEEYVAESYWPYPNAPLVRDDLLERDGAYRVARGGSFARFSDLARCPRRHGFFSRSIYAMGFRVAEDL
ncbi:MAG: formylglycine-generating enzyme family protein [Polyangiaceae bacterium]|jgi:formylglycine-generating enzyme required for sulfatase activity|nr:formylglycine-generating enzyme family protein [Polyangiaceae bacterium]